MLKVSLWILQHFCSFSSCLTILSTTDWIYFDALRNFETNLMPLLNSRVSICKPCRWLCIYLTHGWMDGWIDRYVDRQWISRWMDGWIDGQRDRWVIPSLPFLKIKGPSFGRSSKWCKKEQILAFDSQIQKAITSLNIIFTLAILSSKPQTAYIHR